MQMDKKIRLAAVVRLVCSGRQTRSPFSRGQFQTTPVMSYRQAFVDDLMIESGVGRSSDRA